MATRIPNGEQKQPSLVVRLNSVFGQLHKLAVESVFALGNDKYKYTIFNSAVRELRNGYRFQGAGQHVIVLTPPEGEQADKKNAVVALETYLAHFVGYTQGINYSKLKPIWDSDGKTLADNDIVKESSFNFTRLQSKLFRNLFENVDDEEQISAETGKRITGFYARFDMATGTQNPSVFSEGSAWDQIKKSVSDFVDGIAFQTYNWQNGPSNDWTTIKDIRRVLQNKIDASKLPEQVRKVALADFNLNVQPFVEYDKTLLTYLRSRLSHDAKQALQQAKMSLCVKLHQLEKNYELISKQSIADLVTKSITRGFYAKVTKTNKFTANDVILINNYSDNMKDKTANKYLYTGADYDSDKTKFSPEWRASANKLAKMLKIVYVLLGYDSICDAFDHAPDTALSGSFSKASFSPIRSVIDKLQPLSNGGLSDRNSISIVDLQDVGITTTGNVPTFGTSGVFDDAAIVRALLNKSSNPSDPRPVLLTKHDAIAAYQLDEHGFQDIYDLMLNGSTRQSIDDFVRTNSASLAGMHISNYPPSRNSFGYAVRRIAQFRPTIQTYIGNLSNPTRFDNIFNDCLKDLRSHPKYVSGNSANADFITGRNDINSRYDLYVIPMENLEYEEADTNTRFDKSRRN